MPLSFQYPGNVIHERKVGRSKPGIALRYGVITNAARRMLKPAGTMKHGKTHYGYRNHISIDRKRKVIRRYAITSAEVDDSRVFEELRDENNSSGSVWADFAYRSVEREAALPGAHYRSHIHHKSTRKRLLNEREQEASRKRSRVRARVEHVFAQQANRLVRSIGKIRAGRIKRAMDMDVARKMSVKIPGSPDFLETIGLCRVFRDSLIVAACNCG